MDHFGAIFEHSCYDYMTYYSGIYMRISLIFPSRSFAKLDYWFSMFCVAFLSSHACFTRSLGCPVLRTYGTILLHNK